MTTYFSEYTLKEAAIYILVRNVGQRLADNLDDPKRSGYLDILQSVLHNWQHNAKEVTVTTYDFPLFEELLEGCDPLDVGGGDLIMGSTSSACWPEEDAPDEEV